MIVSVIDLYDRSDLMESAFLSTKMPINERRNSKILV